MVGEYGARITYITFSPALTSQIPLYEIHGYGFDSVGGATSRRLLFLGGITALSHYFVQIRGNLSRFLNGEGAMKADRHPALLSASSAILKDVHPFAGGMDPDTKAGNLGIPEKEIPLGVRCGPFHQGLC